MIQQAFKFIQKIGLSLMFPVAVMPVAGLLLGIGSGLIQAEWSWLPVLIPETMVACGKVIFDNMPLIFAVGVALGLSDDEGSAGLGAVVGFFILQATMGVLASILWIKTTNDVETLGYLAKKLGYEASFLRKIIVRNSGVLTIQTGVFGGIFIGALCAYINQRFKNTKLPTLLSFFEGKRAVPIMCALTGIGAGILLSFVWPPVQEKINALSMWAAYSSPSVSGMVYGSVERLLVPLGLHHIWNIPFFFEIGSYTDSAGNVFVGDIPRFFAGDKTAGIMGGGFVIKMFAMPAMALAIYHTAKPENKAKVAGIMVSGALTAAFTGVTEPIEFTFLFIAPLLYVFHALLVGSAFAVVNLLGMRLGYSFNQGLIDFLLFYPLDTKPYLIFIIGPIYGVLYYVVFRVLIEFFDLKIVGREDTKSQNV